MLLRRKMLTKNEVPENTSSMGRHQCLPRTRILLHGRLKASAYSINNTIKAMRIRNSASVLTAELLTILSYFKHRKTKVLRPLRFILISHFSISFQHLLIQPYYSMYSINPCITHFSLNPCNVVIDPSFHKSSRT